MGRGLSLLLLAATGLSFAACTCSEGAARAEAAPIAPDPAAVAAAEAARLQTEAEAHYAARADEARAEAAVVALQALASLRREDPLPALRLARIQLLLGESGKLDPRERREAFRKGVSWAEVALERGSASFVSARDGGKPFAEAVRGADPQTLATYAASLLGWARAGGARELIASRDSIEAALASVPEGDPSRGAAEVVLGQLQALLPAAAGGDPAASRAHFEKARQLLPGSAVVALAMAESLARLPTEAASREALLREAAATASEEPEEIVARERAKAILGTLGTR